MFTNDFCTKKIFFDKVIKIKMNNLRSKLNNKKELLRTQIVPKIIRSLDFMSFKDEILDCSTISNKL